MNKFSASFFDSNTVANMSGDESDEDNQLEIEELDNKIEPVVAQHLLINQKMKHQQQQQLQSRQHSRQTAMQLDESEFENMSNGEDDDRNVDYMIDDDDDDDDGEDGDDVDEERHNHANHHRHSQHEQIQLEGSPSAANNQTGQSQDPSIVQSLATQMAAAMAAAMAAHQLLSSAASICGLDLTSLSNFAASQAQQMSTRQQNGLQTPEQLMAAAVAAASFLQTNPTARGTANNNSTTATTTTTTSTTIVPEDLTISQQHQQQQQQQQQHHQHALAGGLFGAGLGVGGPSVTSPLGQSANSVASKLLAEACGGPKAMDSGCVGSKMLDGCNSDLLPRSDSTPSEAAANAFMANTFNKQLVAAVQNNLVSKMALAAAANGTQNGIGNVLNHHQQQQQQQQQQSISSAASNYLYHHFGQDAASQQLSSSLLAAAQVAAAAQQQMSNVPNPSNNSHPNSHQQHQHSNQQLQQLNHLNHLTHLAAAGGGPLSGHHHQAVNNVSHLNHLTPTANHHNHHHHNSNSLANSLVNGRGALLNNNTNNNNSNNSSNNNSNNSNASHHQHHSHHHQHPTPTRHLLGHHHHSSIQTQQQLLATKGYNPLAAVVGQQTEILTPTHLRKAKLMFFYVRYPSSSTLKECFRDVRFNKNNTAQLVKWFSNFREFYYIQMEKFARDAINDERIKCKEDIVVSYDHELINQLNNHYNKNRHVELPEVFRQVVEETLRHFFDAIHTKRDQEQSWKKAIYKIIQRMDQEVPDVFKTDAFNEHLE